MDDDLEAFVENAASQGVLEESDAEAVKSSLRSGEGERVPAELLREGDDTTDVRKLIKDATLPQKLKLAMFGNATCRSLLILDNNRLVQAAVLKNPQMRDGEIEEFSKNPNCPEMVLRAFANNKSWMKNYAVKVNLVFNPKTPSDVSLKWLSYLQQTDIRKLAKSKNVPQTLAIAARKRVADMQKRGR